MRKTKKHIFLGLIALLSFVYGCKDSYKVIETSGSNNTVNLDLSTHDSLYWLINPYKESLENRMSEVLNVSDVDMEIAVPEGVLGNFITDLVLEQVNEKPDFDATICLLNNGGFRTPILKGNVTRGMVYELMPFENELVILELDYNRMVDMVNYISSRAMGSTSKVGASFSGMRLEISNGEIQKVTVNGEDLTENKTYKILTSDYLSGGGDDMDFFLGLEAQKVGLKLRDAILNYVVKQGEKGLHLNGKIDGRVQIKE